MTAVRLARRLVRSTGRALLGRPEIERLASLHAADAGHGYDVFGMHRDWIALADGVLDPLYRHYFRVSAFGTEHIPAHGPALFVANHAGTLPIDAAMLFMNVLRSTQPPRALRCIADRFVPMLPFASTLSRMGVVAGSMGNVRHLLEAGELCLIFPEGLPAIGKPFRDRYRLRPFRVGFAELALRCRVPVIPVAVIGSEEQWPQLGRLDRVRAFGLPYLPVVATPLPLPVHYRIHYGPALDLLAYAPGGEIDTESVRAASQATRIAVERLIAQGLSARRGVFR